MSGNRKTRHPPRGEGNFFLVGCVKGEGREAGGVRPSFPFVWQNVCPNQLLSQLGLRTFLLDYGVFRQR